MPAFKRLSAKFLCSGLDLRHPQDLLPEGKYPILKNVRVNQQGVLTVRDSIDNLSGSAIADISINSVRRLTNSVALVPSGGTALLPYTRVVGSGTGLYSGVTALSAVDSGYSGNPLSLLPCQPIGGQDAWMYIADSLRMRKLRGDSAQTDYAIGIAPPVVPSPINYGQPTFTVIDLGNNAWTQTGTAAAPTTPNRFSTTIAAILYDSGSSGWACISPTAMGDSFQPGCVVAIAAAEFPIMREVFEAISTTTIGSIVYDTGTSGLCTVTLAANSTGLQPNAMLLIAASEYVRVLSVTTGADPSAISFRCSTASTRAAGDAVAGVRSFRAYTTSTRAVGNTLIASQTQSTISTGLGILSRTSAQNLSVISSRPVEQDDYIHISIYVDKPENVVEGKFMLDIDPATNDFTKNYLYKAFRASDLQTNVSNLLTVPSAQQVAVQRQILGDNDLTQPIDPTTPAPVLYDIGQGVPIDGGQGVSTDGEAVPSSVQQVTGAGQWSEIVIKVSELVRVGSDRSRSLANVAALRVQLQVSASTILAFSSFTISGTYGPDIGLSAAPLLYAYRYKNSITGSYSNLSPVTRSGLNPKREATTCTVTASADPQVDRIELFRFGAGLDSWRKWSETSNSTQTLQDNNDAISLATNIPGEFDRYQPFPTTDIPRVGVGSMTGTALKWTSGDTFNVNWTPGSIIIINHVPTTIYSVPSTTLLFTVDSIVSGSPVTYTLPGATIAAQPLPVMWGPFGGTDIGLYNFACGDPNDPGILYWTNANDPDSASDKGFKSVTSPSEPLMNGFSVDGRNILFSSERVFNVVQSLSGPNQFTTQEMINGTGLFAHWAFCYKGTKFWYLSKSGIYQGSLDSLDPLQPITDADLYPLFPHDGAEPDPAVPLNGLYYPPDFTQTSLLRLCCDEDSIYFLYQDTAGAQRCLRYDLAIKGWFPYDFTPAPLVIYKEEGVGVESVILGGGDGILYSTASGTSDNSTAISCRVRTPVTDAGDTRSRKYWGDIMVDYDSQDVTLTVIPGFNNFDLTPDAASSLSNSSRNQSVIDLASGAGVLARNLSLDITWSSSTALPILYEWQPSVIEKPELSLKRATDWDDAGIPGDKYLRAVLIEADTLGDHRTVNVLGDGGASTGNTLSIYNDGQGLIPYALTPFNAHLLKLQPDDADQWQLFRAVWIFDPYPELAPITGKWTDAGYPGDKWVQGVRLRSDTAGVATVISIQGDGGVEKTSITAASSGQSTAPFSWPPFIAHMLRTVPSTPARIWDYPETEWIWEPMPELTSVWTTQMTSHDLSGWQPLRDFYIALMSNGDVILTITADSNQVRFSIPNTNGLYRKVYMNQMSIDRNGFWPIKGKVWTYSLTGGPFRLFLKDSEMNLKQWGAGSFSPQRPFGDVSRTNGGARI